MPSTWEPPLSAQILETKQSNRKAGGDPVARLTCDCSGARRMSGTWGAQGSVPVQSCCPKAPDLRRGQVKATRMGEIRDEGASPPPLPGYWAGKVRDDVEAGGGVLCSLGTWGPLIHHTSFAPSLLLGGQHALLCLAWCPALNPCLAQQPCQAHDPGKATGLASPKHRPH